MTTDQHTNITQLRRTLDPIWF